MNVVLFTDIADTAGYGKYAGTYKLATEIRANGHTCQVIDNFSWLGVDRLKHLIDKFITDDTILVGFSCTLNEKRINGKVQHWGMPDDEFFTLLKYIRNKNTKIVTCAGGSRVTNNSDWQGIDYVVLNKGDIAILKLIDHVTKGTELKTTSNKFSKIVNGDDYFYTQENFNCSKIIYEDNDIILPGESLPMEIARGCIFSCAYCHFDLIGKRIGDWTKNPETIKAEMIRNYELYGTTHYMFSDELINESLPKLDMLANAIAQLPFKIRYTSYARVDMIHRYPEMRELLLESGAISLAFGIETFNVKAGKAVGKGLDPDKVKKTLHYCREKWKDKIITSSNFIVGLPGETEQSIWDTVDYLVSDNSPLDVFGFLPLFIREGEDGRPGSKIDADPAKFGYTLNQGKWENTSMSYNEALVLTRKIYTRSDVRNKTKFGAATWIGRILALGYSVEEIFDIMRTDNIHDATKDINDRTNAMKLEYFNRLLNL
jgi:radical SAM superfamily enzyme YgiQ (UPF0313 family)